MPVCRGASFRFSVWQSAFLSVSCTVGFSRVNIPVLEIRNPPPHDHPAPSPWRSAMKPISNPLITQQPPPHLSLSSTLPRRSPPSPHARGCGTFRGHRMLPIRRKSNYCGLRSTLLGWLLGFWTQRRRGDSAFSESFIGRWGMVRVYEGGVWYLRSFF